MPCPQGVFHVELKYTSRGPRLIEVNCRMGGGPVRDTNLRVWGVDLVEEHMLASLGIPSKPLILKTPREHIAEYSVNANRTGRMQNLNWLKVCSVPPCLQQMPVFSSQRLRTNTASVRPSDRLDDCQHL